MTPTWTPSLEEVASLLWARTKDDLGAEAGTFNAETRPTDSEAQNLINMAANEVSSRVGLAPCAEELEAAAKNLAALYASLLIELSYFPEQVTDNSPYDRAKDLYDDGIKSLIDNVAGRCADSDVTEGEGAGHAHFAYDKVTTDLGMNLPW